MAGEEECIPAPAQRKLTKKKFYLGLHQSLLEISSSKHAEIILY
jgi:hypothetical protein